MRPSATPFQVGPVLLLERFECTIANLRKPQSMKAPPSPEFFPPNTLKMSPSVRGHSPSPSLDPKGITGCPVGDCIVFPPPGYIGGSSYKSDLHSYTVAGGGGIAVTKVVVINPDKLRVCGKSYAPPAGPGTKTRRVLLLRRYHCLGERPEVLSLTPLKVQAPSGFYSKGNMYYRR